MPGTPLCDIRYMDHIDEQTDEVGQIELENIGTEDDEMAQHLDMELLPCVQKALHMEGPDTPRNTLAVVDMHCVGNDRQSQENVMVTDTDESDDEHSEFI